MATELEHSSFLAGFNGVFVEELYARYLRDPAKVDASWRDFFEGLKDEAPEVLKSLAGASWSPRADRVIGNGAFGTKGRAAERPAGVTAGDSATVDSIRALMLIRAYRVRGHLLADLDPLGLVQPEPHAELDLATYGFTEADMDRPIFIDHVLGLDNPNMAEIMDTVRETYGGTIGVEYMHIQEPDQKQWIQERIEAVHNRSEFSHEAKISILEGLTEAETFEHFLNTKYPGTKRFGLDGAEGLIPSLEQIIRRGSRLGVEEVVFGMPHRGRLSVLAHVMKKPYAALLSEFQGNSANPEDVGGSGDVKYHLGTSADREFDGRKVHLSLNSNPSHLELVDPVVVGRVRAKQRQLGDADRTRVLGILMHGDAAFSGQGLVAETFALSDVRGYRTGGTIHVVVNNQIGFTTSPWQSRSSPYPSEIAKMVQAPIFHVNGDDMESVVHVSRIATEFRQQFHKDVVIDIWCYRRFGHNESDEPAFTQPLMYRAIAEHPTTRQIYADKLVGEGVLSVDQVAGISTEAHRSLEENFEMSASYKPNQADWFGGAWAHLEVAPTFEERRGDTGVELETLRHVGAAMTRIPDDFNLHPRLNRVLGARRKAIEAGEGIDWNTAEALAFGTLLKEGYLVRLSGQDVQRGTFSQRHAVVIDQQTEQPFTPLDHVDPDQGHFVVHNSPLAEASVLGFEYGLSLTEPNALVMWEAQFGDFVNGAQMIIDQFISSAESKWLRFSGMVMLLPHGSEGQGPEHSSARPERFLQLCGEDNMQVVNATTPANYFHVLRRQIHRKFRKPLIIMTPKSLLRHKLCVSAFDDMVPGRYFDRVISDSAKLVADSKVKRVVLCSGKVYYDLFAAREERGINNVAVVRVEQLYPFPVRSLTGELERYPGAQVVWCQEEPRNMGAWNFIDRRIEDILIDLDGKAERPVYVGRDEAAAPATGSNKRHNMEQAKLVDEALTLG